MPSRLLEDCFAANRAWSEAMRRSDPGFFDRLSEVQRPEMLWIGCSDSRLPPDRIIGRQPGQVFVHRNVANVVVHTDMNCLSVLEYALNVLEIKHVIVCGHYGCGGIRAAMQERPLGLIDNWLRHIRDVYRAHRDELEALPEGEPRERRLCELNVMSQVANVCLTTIAQDQWARGRALAVQGWIYSLSDGLLQSLSITVTDPSQIPAPYRMR